MLPIPTSEHRRRLEEFWIPSLRPLVRGAFDRLIQGERRAFGFVDFSPVFNYFARVLTHGFDNLRLLREFAGLGPIACGNDGGPDPSTPAGVGLELEMLDFCLNEEGGPGFTPADALRVATLNSAHALGLEAQLGSLEPGKIADLAIIDGDPLQERHLLGGPVAALFQGGALVVNRCGLELHPETDPRCLV